MSKNALLVKKLWSSIFATALLDRLDRRAHQHVPDRQIASVVPSEAPVVVVMMPRGREQPRRKPTRAYHNQITTAGRFEFRYVCPELVLVK
jgi:hypothetical protein